MSLHVHVLTTYDMYTHTQARVLYDFDGDEENGELTIKEGDDLTILNQVSSNHTYSTDSNMSQSLHPRI